MLRSLARDSKGQELVEYALTLPILMLLVLGIVEFGVAIFAYNTIANAAREGARVGAVVPILSEADLTPATQTIENAVIDRTGGLTLNADDNINVVITYTESTTETDMVQVTVNYSHTLITGMIMQAAGGNAQLHLQSEATMRREAPLQQ
jgi:Flp pilus assembly protein TadG